jgi:cytochrome c oxidase assembly factor CtaG
MEGLALMHLPLLHIGHRYAWGSWNWEPTVVAGAFIICSYYAYFSLRQPGGIDRLRAISFYAGAASMFLALVSPLHAGADRLLSLHMLQHVVLTTIGPPLVVLGLAPAMVEPLGRPGVLREIARVLANPLVAALGFTLNMWFWHTPPIYQEAVTNTAVHATMHVAFMASGILYWWPVIQSVPAKLTEGGRLLYLFATGMPMGFLALLLIATNTVIYSHYESTPRLLGLSPIEDQQVAGVIMGAIGEFAGFIAISLLFFRYIDREGLSDAPQQPREPVAVGPGEPGP